MKIRVLLFGPYADAVGADALTVAFPERNEVTTPEILAALRREAPSIAAALPSARLAVNERFADFEQRVSESDEVALIGLVSGG